MNPDIFQKQSTALWAKTNSREVKKSGVPLKYHLFLYHLLDSGAVALELWHYSLPQAIREWVARKVNLEIDATGRLIAFWCALHDIGKANPLFQEQIHDGNLGLLHEVGLMIPRHKRTDIYHGMVSGYFLATNNLIPLPIAIAISGHHGTWNCPEDIYPGNLGGLEWETYRRGTLQLLSTLMDVPMSKPVELPDGEETNAFATWLSGFISVADWIASNEIYFSYHLHWESPEEYYRSSIDQAKNALKKLGWIGWQPRGQEVTFADMFPLTPNPRPLQQAVFDIAEKAHLNCPFLMILEAPTGIGKTEIALYISDCWLQNYKGAGLYIGMPTQATSNSIYERTLKVLKDRFPNELVPISLAHSQAPWNEKVNQITLTEIGEEGKDTVVATEWFQNNHKRTLLTPFGVGTVDQAFLGVLQARHFFARLFGLSGKVIIFDEVHAYDSYMNTLFARLLPWLRALGASVIVLSATLPEKFRQQILSAYLENEAQVDDLACYPRLTLAMAGRPIQTHSLLECLSHQDRERSLTLTWVKDDALVETLRQRLENGGCAAIVCNIVGRAVELFKRLEQANIVSPKDLHLFHARFPQVRRRAIEDEIVSIFGKDPDGHANTKGEDLNRNRPGKAIVIATQVIEQSLDLDFDLLISELAPIDLILQRAGRLWRHKRSRPSKMTCPEIILIEPEERGSSVPNFGNSSIVYPPSVLLKTYLILHSLKQFKPTEKTRNFIEMVYGESGEMFSKTDWISDIRCWEQKESEKESEVKAKARACLIETPDCPNLLFNDSLSLLDEEDPSIHRNYRIMTRYSDGLSLQVICLLQRNGRLYLDQTDDAPYINLLHLKDNLSLLKKVLDQSVTIKNSGAIAELLKREDPFSTREIPALHHARILPFEGMYFKSGKYLFTLTDLYGLEINKYE